MKRSLVAILALVLVSAISSAQYRADYSSLTDSEQVKAFKEHVDYLSCAELEGRAPGSEGEAQAASYIYKCLSDIGLEMLCGEKGEIFGIASEKGDSLLSRNVIGAIQGHNPALNHRYIVIGARMDNLGYNDMTVDGEPRRQIYSGANGNASGVAMLIELARWLKEREFALGRTVIFAAFGASTISSAGSWYFLNRSFPETGMIDAMINLDMVGCPKEELYAFTASNADLNYFIESHMGELQPVRVNVVAKEPYPSDHRSFYSAEIPSVMFTTGWYAEYASPRDTRDILDFDFMERELEFFTGFATAMSNMRQAPLFNNSSIKAAKVAAVQFNDCDRRPTFLGSSDPRWFLKKWVYQYLKYPPAAVSQGIQGRVLVRFIIGADGNVKDVSVARGVDPLLDEEAVKVVKASPKWKPGMVNGKKVDAILTLSVDFKLEKGSSGKLFGIKK